MQANTNHEAKTYNLKLIVKLKSYEALKAELLFDVEITEC